MQGKEEVNTPTIAAIGIISAILLFVLIVALQTLYYNLEEKETQKKVYSQRPERLARLRADQERDLTSYRWIDRENGVVGIPIDRAMALVIKELATPSAESGDSTGVP